MTSRRSRSRIPPRSTMKRAVTISPAKLELASAMAAEATRNGLPFKRRAIETCNRARLATDAVPRLSFQRRQLRASEMKRERCPRRYDPLSAYLARKSRRSQPTIIVRDMPLARCIPHKVFLLTSGIIRTPWPLGLARNEEECTRHPSRPPKHCLLRRNAEGNSAARAAGGTEAGGPAQGRRRDSRQQVHTICSSSQGQARSTDSESTV
jgi:hypothetical protein